MIRKLARLTDGTRRQSTKINSYPGNVMPSEESLHMKAVIYTIWDEQKMYLYCSLLQDYSDVFGLIGWQRITMQLPFMSFCCDVVSLLVHILTRILNNCTLIDVHAPKLLSRN